MRNTSLAAVALLLGTGPVIARAQFFAVCRDGSDKELEQNVKLHAQHTFRMDRKVSMYYYDNGKLPPEYQDARLADVRRFLERFQGSAGVLFHAYAPGPKRLCTWLVTRSQTTRHVARDVDEARHDALTDGLLASLNVPSRQRGRAPVPRGIGALPDVEVPDREGELDRISDLLVPPPVARALGEQKVDTLIVVPHYGVGVAPLAALRIAGEDGKRRSILELASVAIAPGFGSFRTPPPTWHPGALSPAIVAGDPQIPPDEGYDLPALPGARAEVQQVSKLVKTDALVGPAATRAALLEAARGKSKDPALVYLATHGLADPVNPLDGSALWLADGRWTARGIQAFPAGGKRPLVVLSACQTGLGKRFEVGTLGMAQAWQLAGARSVVMSLWRVDDAATTKLMTRFLQAAIALPPDKALRTAMTSLRSEDPDPAHWASFAVFGVPER